MKKIIYLALVCAFMFSCSNEAINDPIVNEDQDAQEMSYNEDELYEIAKTRSNIVPLCDYWSSKLTDHMLKTVRNDAAYYRYYRYCGVLARALSSPMPPHTIELHSYWNKKLKDHYYTTSKMQTRCKNKYDYCGVMCYVFKEQISGTIPVYEYYRIRCKNADHFYTTSRDQESSHLRNGYKYVGIAFYAYPAEDSEGPF